MLPRWLKTPLPKGKTFNQVNQLLQEHQLNTVCQSAKCPNRAECFGDGTATFLIMGDVCTRNCAYCNVNHGIPTLLEKKEPARIATVVQDLKLNYVVITSVTRDDLADGGASHFAACLKAIQNNSPNIQIEVLTPDFQGSIDAIQTVIAANPTVFNHNIETTKSLFKSVRPQGNYEQSLQILKHIKKSAPKITTKSGFMIGLGENDQEINDTLLDLKKSNVDIITIGQYLQPRRDCHQVKKFYTPEKFQSIHNQAKNLGFTSVLAGPLVRSSYHAKQLITV